MLKERIEQALEQLPRDSRGKLVQSWLVPLMRRIWSQIPLNLRMLVAAIICAPLAAEILHLMAPKLWPLVLLAGGVVAYGAFHRFRSTEEASIYGFSLKIPQRWLMPLEIFSASICLAMIWAFGLQPLLFDLLLSLIVGVPLVALFISRGGAEELSVDPTQIVDAWPQLTSSNSLLSKALGESKASLWKRDKVGWSLLLELSPGHTASEVISITANLESALKLRRGSLRVTPDEMADRCYLRAVIKDQLAVVERWPGPNVQSVLEPLRLGKFEDGPSALLPLVPEAGRGVSVLIAGQTGAGKSGLLNVIIGSLAYCRDVVLMGIDPQGVELGPWESVFEPGYLALDAGREAEQLLNRLRAIMHARTSWLTSQGKRIWTPSAEQPEIVLIADEAADLVSMLEALFQLARKGRKAGIHLILATQRPSLKALGEWGSELRAQFGVAICLGVSSIADVNIVLGPGAAGEGWRADRMLSRPGEFLISSKHPEHSMPRRARGYLVSDSDVEHWASICSEVRPRLDEISAAAAGLAEVSK